MTGILDRVEASLRDFRPRTQREFVVLQIARRFNDTQRLARYLQEAPRHSKRELLEAARLAVIQLAEGQHPGDHFLAILANFRKEAR